VGTKERRQYYVIRIRVASWSVVKRSVVKSGVTAAAARSGICRSDVVRIVGVDGAAAPDMAKRNSSLYGRDYEADPR